MSDFLKDKTVIITGASRGIGRGIATVLAKNGANVAFTYSKSENEANTLINELNLSDSKIKAYRSNAANFNECEELVKKVVNDFGNMHAASFIDSFQEFLF